MQQFSIQPGGKVPTIWKKMPKCTATSELCSEVFIYFGGWIKILALTGAGKMLEKIKLNIQSFVCLTKLKLAFWLEPFVREGCPH